MIALDNGFEEVVGLVADCQHSARRICAASGYVVRHESAIPDGALQLLGLGNGFAGLQVLLAHPDAQRGAIRLMSLGGAIAPLARNGAQSWDSGGIFDINMRSLGDLDPLHAGFERNGFTSPSPIVDWDFGPLAVREVVERDADGICIALMQRVHPPLTGYEGLSGPASWVFNSTQVVPDFAAARRLFVDHLGWLTVQETDGFAAAADGRNCMGFPPGLAATIPMRIGIYHPAGKMEGSLEIIGFDCGGLDFSDRQPPHRGWASLRLPVSDLDGFAVAMAAAGCRIGEPVEFEWAPHGQVRAIAAITPWGARLEALTLI